MSGTVQVGDFFLEKLFQKVNVGIAVFDREDLFMVWHNDSFSKLCNVKRVKKRHGENAHHLLDFFFPHDEKGVSDLVQIAKDFGTSFDNMRYLLKGERAHFPADIHLYSNLNPLDNRFVALEIHSLSQHMTMEKSEFRRQKLESVLDALNDGILVLTPDLRVSEDSSKQVERILGRHDIVGKSFSEIFTVDNAKVDCGLEAWEVTLRSAFMLLMPTQAHDLLASAPSFVRYRVPRSQEEKVLRLSYAPVSVNNTVAGVLVSLGEAMEVSHRRDKAYAVLRGTLDIISACRISQELNAESLSDSVKRFVQRTNASLNSVQDFFLCLVFQMTGLLDIAKEVERAKSGDQEAHEYLQSLQLGLQHMLPTPGLDPAGDIAHGISRFAREMGLHVEVRIGMDASIHDRDRARAWKLALLLSVEALATRVERESARLCAGKPTPASIRIHVEIDLEGKITLSFFDDGAPYDRDFLLAKAMQEGLIESASLTSVSPEFIRSLIVDKGIYSAVNPIPLLPDAAHIWKIIREIMPEVAVESLGRVGGQNQILVSWISR
jgi:hypothetical protein